MATKKPSKETTMTQLVDQMVYVRSDIKKMKRQIAIILFLLTVLHPKAIDLVTKHLDDISIVAQALAHP